MTSSNTQKVILITGARQGIGRHLAEHYLELGWYVIGCSRNPSDLKHSCYSHYALDISNESSTKNLLIDIKSSHKTIDVLVNNAGVAAKGLVNNISGESIDATFNANVKGAMLITKDLLRLLRKSKNGRIINMSSVHVPLSSTGASVYSASKAALEQYAKVLAKEVFSYGITVNTLSLSVVQSSGMEAELDKAAEEKILENTISKQKISYSDISHAVDFLISENSKLITGQTLFIGGI